MMNKSDLSDIVNRITLPLGWRTRLHDKGDGWLFQIVFDATDNDNPDETVTQYCRKWYISPHMTNSEIVRTVYKAGLAALEHEFDETFKFDGVAIYNPHLDVDDMRCAVQHSVEEDRRGDNRATNRPNTTVNA